MFWYMIFRRFNSIGRFNPIRFNSMRRAPSRLRQSSSRLRARARARAKPMVRRYVKRVVKDVSMLVEDVKCKNRYIYIHI